MNNQINGDANNFDAIRLFMALAVVWSHSFALRYGTESGEPVSILLNGVFNAGNIAVLCFFIMSGFLISLSWERSPDWRKFLRRRVSRILPGYLVAVLFCSLIVVPAFSDRSILAFTTSEWLGIGSNIVLRNYIVKSNAFDGGPVNGSLWSIPYEFWCYILVMCLGMIGQLRKPKFLLVLTLGLMAARIWLDVTGRRPSGGIFGHVFGYAYFWFNVLPPFLCGVLAAHYRKMIIFSPLGALVAGVVLIVVCNAQILGLPNEILARFLFPPIATYLLLFFARAEVPIWSPRRFGDMSFGCYLYAFPIQMSLLFSIGRDVPFSVFLFLSVLLSLVAGFLSWAFIERRFLVK